MSDFLTSLAQTALASASLVQPRLASRFETGIAGGIDDVEVTTESSPSQFRTVQTERQSSPISQPHEKREVIEFPQSRDNLAFREPIRQNSVEHEMSQDIIARDLHPSPILGSPTNLQTIKQDLPSTRVPALYQSDAMNILSPLTLFETREKEMVRTHDHTETVMKEELLPVVQQEMMNLELPETPLLQPALAPSFLKPEVTPVQTPTVQVTIGRLEIRTPPQQKTVRQASKPTGVMSLEEYRRKRGLE